ncbi:hypothetical protein Vretimale_10709, partial [Volvox reticuliferus]
HEWPPDAAAPHLMFSCDVNNLSREVSWERGLFARVSGERASKLALGGGGGGGGDRNGRPLLPEVLSTYRLELRREWHRGDGAAAVRRPERRSYIISQMRGGGEVADLAEQLSKHFGAVVAWGAVAADVTTTTTTGAVAAGTDDGDPDGEAAEAAGPPEDGRAFCFLPLPIRTGLPVHVNGYFELSSNRRDIWYGEDMAGSGARRAHWNVQLLTRVIAPAYAAALTAAAAALGHGEAYDRLWPAADLAQPWQLLLEEFFRRVSDMSLCWSTVMSGHWVAPRSGVLRDQEVARSSPLAAALVEVAALPLLELPQGVGQLMLRHMTTKPRVCSPSLARQALLALPPPSAVVTATIAAAAKGPNSDVVLRTHAPALLDYCLIDLMTSITETSPSPAAALPSTQTSVTSTASSTLWLPQNPAAAAAAAATAPVPSATASHEVAQAAAQLAGLRLLPLLDGTTATFQATGGQGAKQRLQHSPMQHQQQQQQQQRNGPPTSFFLPSEEECTLLARA